MAAAAVGAMNAEAEAAPGSIDANAEAAPAAPPVMEGINAEVPPPKTIFVMAHGKYTVNVRNHIETCILSKPQENPNKIESVVTVSGFPGTAIFTNSINTICGYMNTISNQPTANLQRAFPPVHVTTEGVPSLLYVGAVLGPDYGNSLIKLYKGKDVFIEVTDPSFTDNSMLREHGRSIQEDSRIGHFAIPDRLYKDTTIIPAATLLSTVTISAYVPSRFDAPEPEVTRLLKLNLYQTPLDVYDSYRPWIGVWDPELMEWGPDGVPNAGRLGDIPRLNATQFGPIDRVVGRVAELFIGDPRSIRIVVFCCGVLEGPTPAATVALCQASMMPLVNLYRAPAGAPAELENSIRLYTYMPTTTLAPLIAYLAGQRVFGAAGGAGAGAGGRRQTVRRHKKRRSTVRKASRFGRKGRWRRQ